MIDECDSTSNTDFNKEFLTLIQDILNNKNSSTANLIRKLRYLESVDNHREVLSDFMLKLDGEIQNRDNEIKQFCNTYYQNFVDSLKELLSIQQEANHLKQKCENIKIDTRDCVRKVSQECSELKTCYGVLHNIDSSISSLEICLPIFDEFIKAEAAINERRYYPALKALNHLETNQLGNVSHFAFSDSVEQEIPGMRDKIKSASKNEIKDFLETVRRYSCALGRQTLRQICDKAGGLKLKGLAEMEMGQVGMGKSLMKQMDEGDKLLDNMDKLEQQVHQLKSFDPQYLLNQHPKEALNSSKPTSLNIEDLVDFSPVYRCLHIHSVLGDRHEFEKFYRSQRKRQLTLLLTIDKQSSTRNYCEFFSGIVGFFVVEDYIRYTEMSIVTRNYLDELWTQTITRLGDFTTSNCRNITESEPLLDLKNYCVIFGKAMRSLDFNTIGFREIYEVLRIQYLNILTEDYRKRFQQVFDGEDYTAIQVNDPSDMELVLDLYPHFLTPDIDLLPYPKSLSFSWMVPRIFQLLRQHIRHSKAFCDQLELSHTEIEDQLNFSTNILIRVVLIDMFLRSIHKSEGKLNQLIQLTVNMEELFSACDALQHFIMDIVGVTHSSSTSAKSDNTHSNTSGGFVDQSNTRSRLHAYNLFKDLRSKIEDSIYKAINSKINDIIDDNDYYQLNSLPNSTGNSPSKSLMNPSGNSTALSALKPSGFIIDVTDYLTVTFECFTNLPARLAQTVCILCCKHINKKLEDVINSEQKLTRQFISQLHTDVIYLQEFSAGLPVAGISADTFALIYTQLVQMTDIVLKEDWYTFIKKNGTQDNPYDRLTPQLVCSLIEKIKQSETKFSAIFKSFKKSHQDKKYEEILLTLKEMKG